MRCHCVFIADDPGRQLISFHCARWQDAHVCSVFVLIDREAMCFDSKDVRSFGSQRGDVFWLAARRAVFGRQGFG